MATNKRLIKSNDEGGGGASFNTVIYDGNGGTQTLYTTNDGTAGGTGGFQPDLIWIKNRNDTNPHALFDSVRGAGKFLSSQSTAAESGNAGDLLGSFDNNGFQVNRNYLGSTAYDTTNGSSLLSYVAWCWKAGGAAVENTDGTITSQVSANVEAGFSIVSYTGTDVNNTIGHGLGIAPNVIIFKDRTIGRNWRVYHSAIGAGQNLKLNTTDAASSDAAIFQSTTPTENVFYVGASGDVNANTDKFIAYCFAEVAGFSKFGSYVGQSGDTSGYINCGFEPAFLMYKRYDGGGDWYMVDNKRGTGIILRAQSSAAEQTINQVTFDSTGFTINGSTATNGESSIYMAFANQF